jgi:hypothetical protein
MIPVADVSTCTLFRPCGACSALELFYKERELEDIRRHMKAYEGIRRPTKAELNRISSVEVDSLPLE